MKPAFILLFSWMLAANSNAQTYSPAPSNITARSEFQDARFGLFIHWGIFSILGDGEWVMNNENIPVKDYTRLVDFFNPLEFDAREWVSIAKDAGMKYITLITRHHDGFSMWNTKYSDFNIMNTPYKKDVVKMIADECHKQHINRPYRAKDRKNRQRRLCALPAIHGKSIDRIINQLRRNCRNMV
jgi:alpha-L-fucosidase